MNRRSAMALFALAAITAGCHREEPRDAHPVTPVGKTAPTSDPWNATAKKDPLPHPLLWSIEKDGHTSYALGTMHIGVDPDTRLPELAWQKLAASPQFAMETDLSDSSLADEMMKRPDGSTLHDELGSAYWKKLEQAISPAKDHMMGDMLYARNASWIEPIEKLHAAGGGFIAVGAMHLVGKRSVLDLLRQRGYKVTRLTP